MNIKDKRFIRCVPKNLTLLLLASVSCTGCVTVSCEWPTYALAGDRTAADNDPCAPKDLDQLNVPTVFGLEKNR